MEVEVMQSLVKCGGYAAVAFSAIGSSLGTGIAGSATIGAWKKCYAQNKPAPFLLMAYAGAPLSQTIYGFVLMNAMNKSMLDNPEAYLQWPLFLLVGLMAGLAMGVSAWYQGRAAAGSSDALAETGKGFAYYLMVLGVIETVAIFALVFSMSLLPKAAVAAAAIAE